MAIYIKWEDLALCDKLLTEDLMSINNKIRNTVAAVKTGNSETDTAFLMYDLERLADKKIKVSKTLGSVQLALAECR
jgi:hypothetical protein